MADNETRKGPGLVAPSTRVTVAFPFSSVNMQQPSEEVRELALIVAELAETVANLEPSSNTDELLERVHALVTKLS